MIHLDRSVHIFFTEDINMVMKLTVIRHGKTKINDIYDRLIMSRLGLKYIFVLTETND